MMIFWHRGYLVVVGGDMKGIPGYEFSVGFYADDFNKDDNYYIGQVNLRIFAFRQSAARQMNLVTIYDIQNKFVGKLN